ncbi:MAG: glucosaminidase domain-containing protein [Hyphomicrobiaceae bacterium]
MAAELPVLKTSSDNTVPACATPGRLMAFVQSRNGRLSDNFDSVATEYMRHGESLGVRWDYAFFQMLVETGNLSYRGDVRATQNNFAGLGATGGGVRGESFKNVSDGVKAHLQHILMYAGETIEDPVAERTRNVQAWGVLTKWQKSLKGPMTFTQLTRKWSPSDRGYARDIASVANAFYSDLCKRTDPRPELVAEARGNRGVTVDKTAAIAATDTDGKIKAGKSVSKLAIADTRAASGPQRNGLTGGEIAMADPSAPATPPAAYTILNGRDVGGADATTPTGPTGADGGGTDAPITTADAGRAAAAAMTATAPAKPAGACRVWQASYGGQKAVIIQAIDKGQTNYTVLDVNEGREGREVAAYISAYAKGGTQLEEFANTGTALSKAFELCPES